MIPEAFRKTDWRYATVGNALAGDPIEQRAYLTLWSPGGVLASHLQNEAVGLQRAIITEWFLANYQPVAEGWFGSDQPQAGGPSVRDLIDAFPERRDTPPNILLREFGYTLSDLVSRHVIDYFVERSAVWELISSDQAEIIQLSIKVEELARALTDVQEYSHGRLGHNSGMVLLDKQQIAQIIETALSLREAVPRWSEDAERIREAKDSLTKVLSDEFLKGAAKATGGLAAAGMLAVLYPCGNQLLGALHDLIAFLSHWLATYPPVVMP